MNHAKCLLITAVMASLVLDAKAEQIDTPESRLEAAKRYTEVYDYREYMALQLQAVANALPPEFESAFLLEANENFDFDEAIAVLLAKMAEMFTTDEIDRLTAFFATEEGQMIAHKWNLFALEIAPYFQEKIMEIVEGVMRHRLEPREEQKH